jgi:deazaflavin-dependent oxidoreductase (nitroreductase family)
MLGCIMTDTDQSAPNESSTPDTGASTFDYVKTRKEDVDEIPNQAFVHTMLKIVTALNVWVFKASSGRMWKNFIGGYPICIVETTGRKTGKAREIALIHLPIGDDVLLVASQGGMERNPVWVNNILAEPGVRIMVGGKTTAMTARLVDSEEKASLWPHLLSLYPDFDEYQARTDRDIPVFRCSAVD